MQPSPLVSSTVFHLGPIAVSRPVVTTWAIMLALALASWLATRRIERADTRSGALVTLLVTGMLEQIEGITRTPPRKLLPMLGTLFIFLVVANLSGLLPGVEAPTATLETPAALALIVFASIHYFGIRAQGLRGHVVSFTQPKAIMLPLNLLAEVTRTFSMMVRLFGNVMSGEFVIALLVALGGLFVPVPLMALELLVGLVQAYIFTVLATAFIGAALNDTTGGARPINTPSPQDR